MDHEEYKNYVLEMVHSSQKSPRFQQLQAYYNILDRALKLEKKSSNMDIHKLKSEAVIDFETWRQLRQKEKAKDELELLLSSLREAQRARQFHFRPKEVASVRWRGDIRLRGRDKSVDNLKNHFSKIAEANGLTEDHCQKVAELNDTKDVYKPKWRASTVGNNIKRLNVGKNDANNTTRIGMPKKSSLTPQQVNNIKDQLTEILDSRTSSRQALNNVHMFEVNIARMDDLKAKMENQKLFVKPLSPKPVLESARRRDQDKPKAVPKRSVTKDYDKRKSRDIEEEQRALHKKIGLEIINRNRSQPRVLEDTDKNGDDFLLVLASPSNNEETKASVQLWADDMEERPKSVAEMAKSYEIRMASPEPPKIPKSPDITLTMSVRDAKKSFEELPKASTARTPSFCKAIEQGQKCASIGKLSKSTSSLDNVLDDADKGLFNEFSMSNPDVSDTESVAAKNLRECFMKMSMGNSNPYLNPVSPLMNHYGQKVDNSTKYSRAYLSLVKSGDVTTKMSKFESPNIPR